MKEYITTETVRFGGGDIVGLSEGQVENRGNCLQEIRDGIYKVTSSITLKGGEKISLDTVPKRLRDFLIIPGEEPAKEIDYQEYASMLESELDTANTALDAINSENEKLKATIEELEAENEKLKAPKKRK